MTMSKGASPAKLTYPQHCLLPGVTAACPVPGRDLLPQICLLKALSRHPNGSLGSFLMLSPVETSPLRDHATVGRSSSHLCFSPQPSPLASLVTALSPGKHQGTVSKDLSLVTPMFEHLGVGCHCGFLKP